jgi:hypothetical protein
MGTKSWSELSRRQRAAVVVGVGVQAALAVSAWRDLTRRPAAQVNGDKRLWAAAIGVNFVGPLAYFRWGRRT